MNICIYAHFLGEVLGYLYSFWMLSLTLRLRTRINATVSKSKKVLPWVMAMSTIYSFVLGHAIPQI